MRKVSPVDIIEEERKLVSKEELKIIHFLRNKNLKLQPMLVK